MDESYTLTAEVPLAEDYLRLRIVTGLSPKSAEGAAIGLPNTLFGVVVRHDGRVVGMGRAIGDGGLMLQVTDIAVEPEHQGRGLGKAIVGAIIEHLKRTVPDGAYVSLIADGEAPSPLRAVRLHSDGSRLDRHGAFHQTARPDHRAPLREESDRERARMSQGESSPSPTASRSPQRSRSIPPRSRSPTSALPAPAARTSTRSRPPRSCASIFADRPRFPRR